MIFFLVFWNPLEKHHCRMCQLVVVSFPELEDMELALCDITHRNHIIRDSYPSVLGGVAKNDFDEALEFSLLVL
jgi:hypothetical protein